MLMLEEKLKPVLDSISKYANMSVEELNMMETSNWHDLNNILDEIDIIANDYVKHKEECSYEDILGISFLRMIISILIQKIDEIDNL